MPKARPLGNNAKGIIEDLQELLEANQTEFFNIVLSIHGDEVSTAIQAVRDTAERNRIAIKAMQFMTTGEMDKAGEVVAKFRLKRREPEANVL